MLGREMLGGILVEQMAECRRICYLVDDDMQRRGADHRAGRVPFHDRTTPLSGTIGTVEYGAALVGVVQHRPVQSEFTQRLPTTRSGHRPPPTLIESGLWNASDFSFLTSNKGSSHETDKTHAKGLATLHNSGLEPSRVWE